ncbi:c-type cytochrome [Pseudomonas citronellolis]|uniref:c-type cytochrome n=1 Tax=Pseudomonas citronellolis TaxID=53408 RepID=UPI0023E40F70|nr:cytochrome c [Pseudomonas citronellolis]MDF3933956.1 cytochrome c [Pseudomonas citronellolis]
MRLILSLLILLCPAAFAAELTLELPSGKRTLSSAELLANPQARQIEIKDDVSYKLDMHYKAVPLAALLEGVDGRDHVQAVALDGFAAELPAAPLLQKDGARAWLAIEDEKKPWPPLADGKPSAGPFYLVWSDPQASAIGPEQWPFQVSTLRVLDSVEIRFPALLPAKDANPDVQAGFALFQKHCLACHRLNGAGDAQFGPDLNQPYSPTEYFARDFLPAYIRDPQNLRRWPQAKMPGFSPETLSDGELEQLIDYLRHMAARRQALM